MKVKTSELSSKSLDWVMSQVRLSNPVGFSPIITMKKIEDNLWLADDYDEKGHYLQYGSTPLIAAMRCIVASTLGNEVEIPEDLIK